ncbi:hypothetical protein SDC9_04131 [bioreactor metagenome]|uniref:Uncharacterized protein n=1 Tax=bioreactor metagenome TaxID=1076179 RepID=A0A644SWF3_9ZZZZ|nr:baseplate J/gp47 family protein [Negativicutes bacterium]
MNLPEINFAEKSTQEIETAVITTYEAIAGRTLAPGDPVRLFLQSVAAIIVQQRVLIDYSAKMNLLAYSNGNFLDHIGVLVGTDRLPASAALTTLRFTISAAQPQGVAIPAGTRVTPGNNIFFATTKAVLVVSGGTTIDVDAVCTELGTKGNSYQPGQINKLVDPFQWFQSVVNITESAGGADQEADDAYRERIRQAPESFSVAGPDGAYRFWAMSASQTIIDVSVRSPAAGEVELRPLLFEGEIPGTEMLNSVFDIVNDKKVRPLTDHVTVLAPETVEYDINMTYYISHEDATTSLAIQTAVAQAVADYVLWQKSKLGRDINPSELIWRVRAAGADRAEVTLPIFTALEKYQVAIADNPTVTYGGLTDG